VAGQPQKRRVTMGNGWKGARPLHQTLESRQSGQFSRPIILVGIVHGVLSLDLSSNSFDLNQAPA